MRESASSWTDRTQRSAYAFKLGDRGGSGMRVPPETLIWAVGALAEGLGICAVARVLAVDPNTVLAWLMEVATLSQGTMRSPPPRCQGAVLGMDLALRSSMVIRVAAPIHRLDHRPIGL